MKQTIKNPKINTPITLMIIGILAIGTMFLLTKLANQEFSSPYQPSANVSGQPDPNPQPTANQPQAGQSQPQPDELLEGCKEITYDPAVDYNFVGALDFVLEKPAAKFLEIKKDEDKRLFSLGKFKLSLEPNTVLIITRFWLYFFSEELSDREDKMYGLEDSYLSKIIFKRGEKTKEVNLGRSGEHAFIELTDCPLGNIYPVNYKSEFEFEILLEIGCNNFQNNACLNNKGESLDYINNADLTAKIRLFAISFQDFTKDIFIPIKFKY